MGENGFTFTVVRHGEKIRSHRELPSGKNPLSYAYHGLFNEGQSSKLKPYMIEFQNDIREEIPLVSHEGEEFLFILEGEVEFHSTEGNVTLRKGDSLHFDARIAHGFVNSSKKIARAIGVIG